MFEGPFTESLLKRAQEKGLISINIHDIRDEAQGPHRSADDTPFGGGPGMVMLAQPIINSLDKLRKNGSKTVFLSPAGKRLDQSKVKQLAKKEHLIIICGHYEGVDERLSKYFDEEISVGDYVLTGGELPAAILVDSICRYIRGVVKEAGSVENDSFSDGLLDFPHYTRPAEICVGEVPEVLRAGDHEQIRKWRRKESLRRTLLNRPELFAAADISSEDRNMLAEIILGD